ncbi:MAG: RNA polymerase sigma factor [Sterolibacteriaceae bacterium]|uniref:RNA polymerase sigma factor n=1 Tax=Candidatus Methylophosphatis roskildensis TaxID=2899263 RepID=A0A9D7HTW7_9PROT|nr:RNA polymerase sigma factor [Candidatus Methylophosphatis roskildensis]MBK7237488.1 RNA polymerase sigma factor [Sterolibacteriaceae bacterium]
MDSSEFIAACREGGNRMEAALRALYRAWGARLTRECLRISSNRALAEDVVQETLIKAWRNCAQYRGDSELLPWLKTILRNQLIDRLRRDDPEEPIDGPDGLPTAKAQRTLDALSRERIATPETELSRREVAECMQRQGRRFLEQAPRHAAVIAWIAEDGLSNEQVAALLGRTPGATREFISQARKKAREFYAECYRLAFGGGSS